MQAAALQLELLAVGQGLVGVRQFEREGGGIPELLLERRALRLRAGILAPAASRSAMLRSL